MWGVLGARVEGDGSNGDDGWEQRSWLLGETLGLGLLGATVGIRWGLLGTTA